MLVGYPTPGKEKARVLVTAFCKGAGGKVVSDIPKQLLPGGAVFYGVTSGLRHLFDQCRREGRDWYYIDNAYFDTVRGKYFRVTKNRLQHPGIGESNGERWARLGITIKPWRGIGAHILVCPQSGQFMHDCAQHSGSWLSQTMEELLQHTIRETRVRPWTPDKVQQYKTLPEALKNCWQLVTYSSASAISAILAGVPAICTASDCIALPVSGHRLADIESPRHHDNRGAWCRVVADQQFTIQEMEDGTAWKMLNESAAGSKFQESRTAIERLTSN
jgi:hypothetical protein